MTENNKREYDAPMVELMEARVEKGFVGSGEVEPQPQETSGSTEGLTGSGDSYGGNDFD